MKASELIKNIIKFDLDFELEDTTGVYIIYCLASEKAYVGKSKNIRDRWRKHRTMLNCRKHRNPHLQNAWIKHGKNLFVFGVLEVLKEEESLADREKYYIDLLDKNYRYNCQDIPNEDFNISEETRQKMSLAHLGKTLPQEL
jgi:group I intron endonuclease